MNIQRAANGGAKSLSGNLAPQGERGRGAGMWPMPGSFRRSVDGKSLLTRELRVVTRRKTGGALCCPRPIAPQVMVWEWGVSDPYMARALSIFARPQGSLTPAV